MSIFAVISKCNNRNRTVSLYLIQEIKIVIREICIHGNKTIILVQIRKIVYCEVSDIVVRKFSILGKGTEVIAERSEMYAGDMILVNKQYPCHHDGEETVSLMGVKTDSYMVTDYNVSLNESIIENLNQWLDDFRDNYGESDVMIACGYRSRSNQEEIFNNEVDDVGEEEAVKWVAKPGYSEHQTGYVIDFTLYDSEEYGSIKYDGTGTYEWINENCYKYGFILRISCRII